MRDSAVTRVLIGAVVGCPMASASDNTLLYLDALASSNDIRLRVLFFEGDLG